MSQQPPNYPPQGPWQQPPQWSGQPQQPPPQWPQPNTNYSPQSGAQWQGTPPPPLYQGQPPYQQLPYSPRPGMMGPPSKPPKKKLSRGTWILLGVGVVVLMIFNVIFNANKSDTATTATVAPTATTIFVNSQATDTPIAPTATSKPQPTTRPTPSFANFGDGIYQVGKDIQPGTYRTRSGSAGCYYERLKGFSGDISDVIANDDTDDPAIVTILASDKGFDTQSCGTWTKDLSQITTSKTTFPDGMYFIGTDITLGTYKNDGSTGCYYARLSNFNGGTDGIIANNNVDTPTIVTIASSDKGFQSKRCGTWTKI